MCNNNNKLQHMKLSHDVSYPFYDPMGMTQGWVWREREREHQRKQRTQGPHITHM
jgi:hypothetical protein